MEAYKFGEIMRFLNVSLQDIPLSFYHINLMQERWET